MEKRYIYNDGKEITSEEAHQLEDKTGIMTSKNPIKFKKEIKKNGRNIDKHGSSKRD